ncbi:MAG: hypothetical protein ACR652_20115 [Methylocystis sp.]|uniref:hypothetical protein n=1 Tax=Methylocystis sp. TaxID=1911079 RepID=UPI003DA2F7DA
MSDAGFNQQGLAPGRFVTSMSKMRQRTMARRRLWDKSKISLAGQRLRMVRRQTVDLSTPALIIDPDSGKHNLAIQIM